jgi:hypothetical protein
MKIVYYEARGKDDCVCLLKIFVVYYESRKRELKRRLIIEGRCDERLKAKVEESTCLTYTGLTTKQTGNTSEKDEDLIVVYYESIKRDPWC